MGDNIKYVNCVVGLQHFEEVWTLVIEWNV